MDQPDCTMPLIGDRAPSFSAETTQGQIRFPDDYEGRWIIFFSHPADFTPVCTTEFMRFAVMLEEFRDHNCDLLGLSVDSTYSHIAWLRTIKERIVFDGMRDVDITFPVISDLTMEIARKYGMIHPSTSGTQAVRAVFVIDPKATVRAVLYYPLSTGRNMREIKRLLLALQLTDDHNVATPSNWEPGDDVIIPPPGSCGTARERVAMAGDDYECLDWFLCLRRCPRK